MQALTVPGEPGVSFVAYELTDPDDQASTLYSPDTSVQINWDVAYGGNGSPITQYRVYFKTSSGGTYTYTTGALSGRQVTVPMSNIRSYTGMGVNNLIQVRIQAWNQNG